MKMIPSKPKLPRSLRNVDKLETKHLPTLIRIAKKYHKKNIQESKNEMRYRLQLKNETYATKPRDHVPSEKH